MEQNQNQKFDLNDVEYALNEFSMLRFWPSDAGARGAISNLLTRMVPSREALQWLVRTMVDRVGEWKGPTELRGLLCWKFKPADGIEANCSIAGFTPGDGEQQHYEKHAQLKGDGWTAPGIDEIARRRRLQ